VDLLAGRFRHWDDATFRRARDRQMSVTERQHPDLIEEVGGIADGAGMPFEMIYLTSFYASMKAGLEGCSNVILTDTPDGPLLARTNDLPVHEGKHTMIRILRPAGGMAVICSSWIGTVWRGAGVNEAGVALGGSSCAARVPEPEQFLNPHAMGHHVLSKATSVEEAITLLGEVPASAWGANHALLDRRGAAAVVEKAGALQGVRRPDRRRLWCTNHALTPELRPWGAQTSEALRESVQRYDAIDRLTRDAPPDADLARSVVARTERPGALCRYADDDPLGYETECATILYPARCEAEFCFSHADRDPWHRVSLTGDGGRDHAASD
jgi:isopenicillin-N N-acyltransferase like protein